MKKKPTKSHRSKPKTDFRQLTLIEPYISPTAIALPETITFERWEEMGKSLHLVGAAARWWVGDWLAFGEDHFKDRAIQMAEIVGIDPGTLANIVKVCRGINPKRRTSLSFEHHKEVYMLPPAEQERWLSKAIQNHWTRADLRGALKDAELRKRGKSKKVAALRKKAKKQQSVPTTQLYETLREELRASTLLIPPLVELTTALEGRWSERLPSAGELGMLEKLVDEARSAFYDLLAVARELMGLETAAA